MSFTGGVPSGPGATSSLAPDKTFSELMPSPVSEWSDFLNSLEKDLVFPVPTPSKITPSSVDSYTFSQTRPCPDAVMLVCGCIMSEKLFLSDVQALDSMCPICNTPTEILAPVMALRSILSKISAKKQQFGLSILSGSDTFNPIPPRLETQAEMAVTPYYNSNVDIDDISSKYAASLSSPSYVPYVSHAYYIM